MTTISTMGDDERKGEVTSSTVDEDERKGEVSNLVSHEEEQTGHGTNTTIDTVPQKGETTRRKSRGSMDGVTDEESLRLIKELQAQDYGLRKRGKA